MEQAITAPRVEEEAALGAMLAEARGVGEANEEDVDHATKRVVSDKEWQLLQQEVVEAGSPSDYGAANRVEMLGDL